MVTARLLALLATAFLLAGPLALSGIAAEGLEISARVLLQGHARVGAWTAIQVDLTNDGPPIDGELQLGGGGGGNVRYAMEVKLPTGSRQSYVLHAQFSGFGRNVTIDLVQDGAKVDSVSVAYLSHEVSQLVVGVLAEKPGPIVEQINLPNSAFGAAPAVVPLTIADLPERAEGWAALDRLVWQDVDSNQLSAAQLEALRRWIAAGGRLVIVGGSAGIGTLSAIPDDLLPYRPTATVDIDPSLLTSLIGPLPTGAADLPAMGGELSRGRALARSGDRVVAAELPFGGGRITVYGFDPTTAWLAKTPAVESMWRATLPPRAGDGTLLADDSQLVQAVYQLPALALPPTSGLLIIIGAYIVIVGPINYLVLRRLDRRELAWVTTPILVAVFAVAAFGFGSFLRGTDVVVNEIAVVRGANDATEASAQVWFGIFSPTRTTYQVLVPQGALLAAPINGDPFGQGTTSLDIVQGTGTEQPSQVRNLSVGTGSLRTVKAQLPYTAPRMKATLTLREGKLTGTFENASDKKLENVAVVLGSSVALLGDVGPSETKPVELTVRNDPFGVALGDQIIGPVFDQSTVEGVRRTARYMILQQLTSDPMGGMGTTLPADQAVILAFGQDRILDLQIGVETPRHNANVLYYVPVGIGVAGQVAFSSDLIRSTQVESDAQFFSKDRFFNSMGFGSATFAYQPIPFEGAFTATEVRFSLTSGGIGAVPAGKEIEPLPSMPVSCTDAAGDVPEGCLPWNENFMPDVDVFDRTGEGEWVRLPRMTADVPYSLKDPARYVDPGTGQLLVRFVNDNPEGTANFGFQLVLIGDVE